MEEFIKETVTTRSNSANTATTTPSTREATSSQTIEYLIYFFFGVLDILLVFRLVLKLMGANVGSAFVGAVYGITGLIPWSISILHMYGVLYPASTAMYFGLPIFFLTFSNTVSNITLSCTFAAVTSIPSMNPFLSQAVWNEYA